MYTKVMLITLMLFCKDYVLCLFIVSIKIMANEYFPSHNLCFKSDCHFRKKIV